MQEPPGARRTVPLGPVPAAGRAAVGQHRTCAAASRRGAEARRDAGRGAGAAGPGDEARRHGPGGAAAAPGRGVGAEAGVGQAGLYARCSATAPTVRLRQATRSQPASAIFWESAAWSGQSRIDSAR